MEEKKKRKSYPEYTANYTKNNYKRYEFKVRLDNTKIINHLASITNVNQYIQNLIIKDIEK